MQLANFFHHAQLVYAGEGAGVQINIANLLASQRQETGGRVPRFAPNWQTTEQDGRTDLWQKVRLWKVW